LITFLNSVAQVFDGWGGEVFRFAQRRAHRGGVHRLLFVQVEIYSVIPGEQLECIRVLRVTVGTIIGLLAAGHSIEKILKDYPYLEEADIRAALQYAAWRVEEIELPLGA
jgi:hypothetical protein